MHFSLRFRFPFIRYNSIFTCNLMQYSSIFHFFQQRLYRTGFGDRRWRCANLTDSCDSRRQRWSVARGRLSEDKQQPDIEGKLKRWLIYTMTVQFGEQFRFFFIRYRGSRSGLYTVADKNDRLQTDSYFRSIDGSFTTEYRFLFSCSFE